MWRHTINAGYTIVSSKYLSSLWEINDGLVLKLQDTGAENCMEYVTTLNKAGTQLALYRGVHETWHHISHTIFCFHIQITYWINPEYSEAETDGYAKNF
jgi:hypothetical protein